MADSLRPHGLQPARLLCPWDSPGKNIAVGCHLLLQGSWGDLTWVSHSTGRFFTICTTNESKVSVLWPLDVKSQLIGKDPHAGKDQRQKEKRVEEDKTVKYHQLNGHECEQTPGNSGGPRSLVCSSPPKSQTQLTTTVINIFAL